MSMAVRKCGQSERPDCPHSQIAADILAVEPVPQTFEAFGFVARRILGTSIVEVLDALEEARNTADNPFAMICDTRQFDGIGACRRRCPWRIVSPLQARTGMPGLLRPSNARETWNKVGRRVGRKSVGGSRAATPPRCQRAPKWRVRTTRRIAEVGSESCSGTS